MPLPLLGFEIKRSLDFQRISFSVGGHLGKKVVMLFVGPQKIVDGW